ncbi:Serine/threonine-protein kinase PknD [Streptomyces alboniger]
MGRVWRAVDDILDRQVAVKEMRIDGLDAEDARTRRERTLREARATARIDHPNVVRVYDVVDEGERLWIVMELVSGRSLEQILAEDGPLGPRDTALLGLGLVEALRQVHERGVLHRDIKPGNVLVGNGGRFSNGPRVVLTDFGIAAIQDAKALTMVGMLVGSPDYMAPERISGRPQGPPSDVWSLGATLCAALGGRSPFSRDTTLATLHAVLYEQPELPTAAGPLRDILAALLEKEPQSRPGLADLEAALQPLAFPPPPTPTVAVAVASAVVPAAGSGAEAGAEVEAGSGVGSGPVSGFGSESGPESGPRSEFGARSESEVDPAPDPDPEPDSQPEVTAAPDPEPEAPEVTDAVPVQDEPPSPESEKTRPLRTLSAPGSRPTPTSTPPALPPAGSAYAGQVTATGPHPLAMPPGELPGPAVPSAAPRRGRRRAELIAAVGVVTAGAVVAIVLAATSGSPDTTAGSTPSTVSSSSPSPSATATATATATASASDSPTPTVEGTSRPQSLPPGAHREAGGFAWATPRDWRRDVKTGAEVHYTSPDGKQELAAKSALARGDLMETWETSEQNAHQGRDYQKIRLEETTFRGHPAVVWEYTFTLQGVRWRARLLGFNADGKSYQINTWYQPDIETQALKTYGRVRDSFTVL